MTTKKVIEATIPTADVKKVVPAPSDADNIWAEIRGLDIQMFALPPQSLESYAKRVDLDPKQVHVTLTIEAALPIIEEKLGKKFVVQRHDKWITIVRAEVV